VTICFEPSIQMASSKVFTNLIGVEVRRRLLQGLWVILISG
jgi:hypothetical protein